MIRFKHSVEFWREQGDGLLIVPTPAFWRIVRAAEPIWMRHGAHELVITSIFNGVHTRLSEHWQGNAPDLRTRNLPGGYLGDAARSCAQELWDTLGPRYTVILEPDHIHAHHEPGGGKLILPPTTV